MRSSLQYTKSFRSLIDCRYSSTCNGDASIVVLYMFEDEDVDDPMGCPSTCGGNETPIVCNISAILWSIRLTITFTLFGSVLRRSGLM